MVAFNKLFSSRLKYLALAWLIISLVIALEMKIVGYFQPENGYSDTTVVVYFFIEFLVGYLLIVTVIIPLYDIIKDVRNRTLQVLSIIAHGILFGFLYTLSFAIVFELYNKNTISPGFHDRLSNLLITDSHNSVRTFLIFMAILFAHDYFRKNIESIIRQKSLENEMDRVKLQSLRAQLQPHFLFNALNNTVALIDENKSKAQQSLIDLSDLLRYTVNLEPNKLVSIQEEINTIKTYVNIEKAKYESQLKIIWEISPELTRLMVPPLIIQPLVENAIKHGFKNHNEQLTVSIRINKERIEVKNNGSALSKLVVAGNGLQLVKKRLQVHFNDAFDFGIQQEGDWIVNTIIIHEHV